MAINIMHKDIQRPINIKQNTCTRYVNIQSNKTSMDRYQNLQIKDLIEKIIDIEEQINGFDFTYIDEAIEQILSRLTTLETDVNNLKDKESIHVGTTEGPHDEKTLWFEILN